MKTHPYLNFKGRAEEAIAFYQKALGAQVPVLMRMKDSPDPHPPGMMPPGSENKVMHAELHIGDSVVMCTDGECTGDASFSGISLTLSADNDAQTRQYFDALADGGKVNMPLAKTFFASSFGFLNDRFGVPWMIITGQ